MMSIDDRMIRVVVDGHYLLAHKAEEDFERVTVARHALRLFDFVEILMMLIVILNPVQQGRQLYFRYEDRTEPMVNQSIRYANLVTVRLGRGQFLDVNSASLENVADRRSIGRTEVVAS